jgi:arylsulfatase A-like enzyme/Tfp pilus assembly protein PilF
MSWRWFSLLCLGPFLSLGTLCPAQTPPKNPPDVYLITLDTLRADHVRCYGYDKIQTPALDALCRDGVRFTQAFTSSPITNTSHASIFTGQLPSVHGVTDFGVPLGNAHLTLAEMLKQRGYATAAFIGAVILDSTALAPGFNRGFDFYDNFPAQSDSKSRWGRVERRGMEVVARAEAWLAKHPAGPRFVWIHLYDAHDPYEPPAPFSEIYKDRLYDGEIAYADSALAHFVAALKKSGAYQRSLLIVTGDHGEGLGEHGEDTHGVFLYDSTLHVPLLMKLPGSTNAGKVVETQVRTLDILPTVIALTGATTSQRLDGASLLPLLQGAEANERPAFGETDYPQRFGWAPLRSLRAQGHKFIEAPKPELYDLKNDARELHNLYAPWEAQVQKMRAALAELRAGLPPPPPSGSAVPQRTVEELRALGYLGAADVGSATNVPEPSLLPDAKDRIEEQNLLHRAMMAGEEGRSAEARAAFEKVITLNPTSATALAQMGEMELQTGDIAHSAEHLQRARKLRPEDAGVALHLGEALEKTGDLPGARNALEASLKFSPAQFAARLLLGNVLLRLHAPAAAEDQLEAAALLQPKSAEVQLALAKAYEQLGKSAEAKEAAAQAAALGKKD